MKSRLVMTVLAATLLAAAGAASAQQQLYYRTAQVPGQTTPDTTTQAQMDQGATLPGAAGDTSYGGVPMSRGASGMGGNTMSTPCTRGPQCDIFFGN